MSPGRFRIWEIQKMKFALIIAAFAMTLGGCAVTKGDLVLLTASVDANPCDNLGQREHCVIVRILSVAGHDEIKLDRDPLKLGSNPRHRIFWKLDPSTPRGYSFPDDAITFKNNYGGQLYDRTVHVDRRHCWWRDFNTDSNEYFYTVKVMDPAGRPITLDPSIVNG